ncbi:helix-turn-helix domain-containing protein [Luteimonas saliphila]|uniref:helix-turn-helix domain-containing protein n=1 Tax=Luteimonas saliphila TaxID=2804919 RepID=UPI00192DC218|nr:helix-turn-helix domain-containing protein [Luteimonas saliphila]
MTSSDQMAGLNGRGDGERLRLAREAAGLEIAEVARRLKMPVRVIESLEADAWDRLDAPVFVRGQLRSYARLLGVRIEQDLPIASASVPIEPARLEPRTYTPPLRRVADRMMGRMVYIVITALIAVPVWMATRSHLDSQIRVDASLDLPSSPEANAQQAQPAPAVDRGPRPLVASMASLPQRAAKQGEPVPALSLRFSGDSWVEIFDADGDVLERGLLKAGERRDFGRGEVGRVVIGNADAVEVRGNDSVQDLSAFQRANVARFTVSSDGSIAPAGQ